ncbi:MAG TPA: RHS repeat-associated core domain-containing protein, partial [Candidatus Methylomirabilis sp.]|nr:RHS repeat-associated core domain-containing protein [Candidatus Methylomirabilis sp.]
TRVSSGPNAGTYFPHGDHLGSLNVLTKATGEAQRLTYLPFGETHTNTGTVDFDPYRFTGQEQDPETGLYYYGARYYNPALGRFISADNLVPDAGDPQTLNRYSYVRNNPINLVDPSGRDSADPEASGDSGDPGGTPTGPDDGVPGPPDSSPNPDFGLPDLAGYDVRNWTEWCDQEGNLRARLDITTIDVDSPPAPAIAPSPSIGPATGQVIERTLTARAPAVSTAADPPGFGSSPGGIGPGVGAPSPSGPLGPTSPALAPKEDPSFRYMREQLTPLATIAEVFHYVKYPAAIAVGIVGIVGFGVVAPAAIGVAAIGYMFTAPTVTTAVTLGYVGFVSLVGAIAVGYAGVRVGLGAMRR